MICDLQVWIELRSISAYHFWSSLGSLVHVNLHWQRAKVCNHSLPMPSPCWWITMKAVSSQDPKEAPLCQGTVRARDSMGAGSQSLSHHPIREQGRWGAAQGADMGSWAMGKCGELWGCLGRAARANGVLWALTLWYHQRSLSTVQLLVFSLLMNISPEHMNYEKSYCAD